MKISDPRSISRLSTYLLLLVITIGVLSSCSQPDDSQVIPSGPASQPLEGFARAAPGTLLAFPDDFGPHDDYLTEWWYYTGNLDAEDGSRFGYQLTFFRRALASPGEMIERSSSWSTEQVYLAHFALSDIDRKDFHAFERFSRGAADLAGAQADPFQVWLYDWSVEQTTEGVYRLQASQDGIRIDLELKDLKGPVLQGEQGYSQKGPDPGNASYYYSQTRLESSGRVEVRGAEYLVKGLSWMDHEFSTSALTSEQVGWDWFSFQLDEGSDLMLFQIRQVDGSIDPFSSGTLVAPDGSTMGISRDEFEINATGSWKSPHSGAVYPAGWEVRVPAVDLVLVVTPLQADQELNLTYTYWEGAVSIEGTYQGQAVNGKGYIEMTGYAGSFAGEF